MKNSAVDGSVIIAKVLLAPIAMAECFKNIANSLTANSSDADAVKMFYSLYCFNYAIDKAYDDVRNSVFSNSEKLDEYIRLFNIQKELKTKLYQSMDQLRNKKDAYTKERIDTVLNELEKSNLITFE